jgi:hypothetical protein
MGTDEKEKITTIESMLIPVICHLFKKSVERWSQNKSSAGAKFFFTAEINDYIMDR